ncbi:retrotransposon protein, putative, ty1-copia subclass [Tanacetum coccineum]
MVPTKKVDKTPYKVWHGQDPKLSYLKVWGCEALIKRDTLNKPNKLEPRSINSSRSLDDLEIIQDEDTHPSLDTSLNHEEDDQEIDEPQSDINPIRRSKRMNHPIYQLCLYVDAEEHGLGDLDEPANYKAALLDHESNEWLNAMNVEMQSTKGNEVWELVYLPPNREIVGHKWLYKKKTDVDGAVHTYKACLVAKGFTQTLRINYEETFSPIADIRSIRILIAIATFYDDEIWQMDVNTSFLNGYLNEEVYMEKPEGFVSWKFPNRNITSRFQQNPGNAYWIAIKNILNYLRHTKDMFLDCGGAVDWKSIKQSIFATSSTYAKYITAFDASKGAVWVHKFISWPLVLPKIKEPINMYYDNTGAIAIAKDHGVTKCA